jgi:hypothetical protein
MMKVLVKNVLYLCISLSFGMLQAKPEGNYLSEASTGAVKIIDVSHHKGVVGEKITFRFNAVPLFNHLPSVPDAQQSNKTTIQEHHFFLPNTSLRGDTVKRFVQQMNATVHPSYYVSLEPVTTPMEGYLLTVKFDSEKVGFQLESGSSPRGEPSITFTFYDHGKLQVINARHSTVLNVASFEGHSISKKKYA